ncbi:MAG: hypothetical protein KC517_07460 [Bacteroidetes bacterium]|jgi:hypothetical protein|nr:hypothetical protein [Bacteroidota bacterium]
MHIPSIKKLVEQMSLPDLQAAEEAILEEQTPAIEVPGADEGEQLTHVIAAIWIKEDMASTGRELKESLRDYTKKVRKSID